MKRCHPAYEKMKVLVIVLLFFCGKAAAQTDNILPVGVCAGGADVAYHQRWQPWQNPSALATYERVNLQIGYENRYFSADLNDAYAAVAIPTRYFNIGVAYNFFGFKEYNEMMAAATIARQFGKVRIGIEFDYFNTYSVAENLYRHAFTAQVGMLISLPANTTLGVRLFNPLFSKINYADISRRLPVMMQVGTCTTFAQKFDLLVQLGYSYRVGIEWALGAEYRIINELTVTLGVRGRDFIIPSLGAGVNFHNFSFNLKCEYDYRVGICMISNLAYQF